ncbi:M20/M25/M40 family metallo-hydrolase [Ancylobacter mangrovi]|uniref:M20/M25/M40 family metallo-hydrolase n=1 Tax=Ancylobacter mangrovi TaxID=2972472 RepID=UPI002162CFB5|nr:M20/M25/M40 family metallo-hydrolase [Ancylobacter mangrovi]MCS0504633.1 M20/M25/M40 family metallo-hydrolase [Ancylobacter mangrovi]
MGDTMTSDATTKDLPDEAAGADADWLVEATKRLVACPSGTPPGDTRAMTEEIVALIADLPGIEIERHPGAEHVMNLVLRLKGGKPGPRLVFNGHMDTFPLGNAAEWTADPTGEAREGKLYGLGVSDMKAGIAAILFALRRLAPIREQLAGELVATFAGDEETMGVLGSRLLLDTVPHAGGDVMISADAGSPRVLRFGEKGMIWMKLSASGRSAHAAHVHKGESALEKLIDAIAALRAIRDLPVAAPQKVVEAIAAAGPVSEELSGAGESEVLGKVTVTFGTMSGGRLSNLVADHAEATADVRIPVGISVATIEAEILRIAAEHGVAVEITRRYEASWTDPEHPVIGLLARNVRKVLDIDPVLNMRVGASDARHYRAAGVPTVVCGLTPVNMGAADEHVAIDELVALGRIYVLTAFDYLAGRP